jgi:hypothetical protein
MQKEMNGMQAYRAKYERGRVIPFGNPVIPEGRELIVTVLDSVITDDALSRQKSAVSEYLEDIRSRDEPLGAEFDEMIGLQHIAAQQFREAIQNCNEPVPDFERVELNEVAL